VRQASGADGITDEFRVTVLLKEYDTLRTEVLARIRSRFELLTVSVAALGFLLSRKDTAAELLVLSGIVVFTLHTYFGWSIAKINHRLADIESQVNRRVADEVLVWESQMSSNFFIRFRQLRTTRKARRSGDAREPTDGGRRARLG